MGNFLTSLGNSLLGGIPQLAGSAFNSLVSLGENSRNRKFQSQQAELQRQFNSLEAQKARDFTREMYLTDRNFNLPQNEKARLEAAGLHPAFFMGNGANAALPAAASASSSASPSGSSIPPSFNISSASDYLKIKQAEKIDEETNAQRMDNAVKDILNSQRVTLNGLTIQLKTDEHELNQQQAEVLAKTASNIEADTRRLEEAIKDIKIDIDNKTLDRDLKEATFNFKVEFERSNAHIRGVESSFMAETLAVAIYSAKSRAAHDFAAARECDARLNLLKWQATKTKNEAAIAYYDAIISASTKDSQINILNTESDYATANKIMDLVSNSIGAAVGAAIGFGAGAGGFKALRSLRKPVTVGFRP